MLFFEFTVIQEQPFLVKNETNRNFTPKTKKIITQMTPDISPSIAKAENYLISYAINGTDTASDELNLENGIYIILVINGTATLSGIGQQCHVTRHNLIILTPSLRGKLTHMSSNLEMKCMYIDSDYFDSTAGALPLYNQLVRYHDKRRFPVIPLEDAQADYLYDVMKLFSNHLSTFGLYRNSMQNSLCSFLLLQVTDLFCEKAHNVPVCIRRSNEIYRKFKRLSVDYYKTQHNIKFYAEQLNVSTTYLSRIVKQTSGRTVHAHLTELQLSEAKRLLECSVSDIKQIADTLGFSDQSAFGKFFVKQTGVSPLRFRLRTKNVRITECLHLITKHDNSSEAQKF